MATDLIRLTKFGDMLREDPENKVTGKSYIRDGVKWHGNLRYRCSTIEVVEVSETHYRLVCARCGTIVIVPSQFDTRDGLARWCADKIDGDKPENQWGLPIEFTELEEGPWDPTSHFQTFGN